MTNVKSTRLRYISSPDASGLEAAVQSLPFKIEIKSIIAKGTNFYCWFVIPDNIRNVDFEGVIGNIQKEVDVDIASLDLEKI